MRKWIRVVIVGALILQANHAAAEHSLTELSAIAGQTQSRDPSPERLEQTRKQLRAALDELTAMLNRSGATRKKGWQEYLNWPQLEAAANGGKTDSDQLKKSYASFGADKDGLELPQFSQVRDALREYINLREYASNKALRDRFPEVMKSLQAELAEVDTNPHSIQAAQVGMYAGWLRDYGQAPELVTALEQRFGHPNAHFQASGNLISNLAAVDINDQRSIRNVILGTTMRGSARTTGNLRVKFEPAEDQARFDLFMEGVTKSRNTGTNRGVRIFSRGTTSIRAAKRIAFDPSGVEMNPSNADCRTRSSITGICARSRLMRKIASRQASKKKSQAEQIASRIAERQVQKRMDSEAKNMLGEMNQKYLDKFRNPLLRRGEFPEKFVVSTTESAFLVRMQHAGRYQLAAPDAAPAPAADHDASLRIHQSLVGNLSEPFWGGYTLTDEKLLALLEENDMEVPDELKIGRDRWSITFADRQPMQITFVDDGFTVAINLKRIRSPRRVPYYLRISAKYTFTRMDGKVIIQRDGDVVVRYPRETRLSARQVAAARFLRSKMRALFREKIEREGIELPEKLASAGTLKLSELRSQDGWLSLGWQLKKPVPTGTPNAKALSTTR